MAFSSSSSEIGCAGALSARPVAQASNSRCRGDENVGLRAFTMAKLRVIYNYY
jgi:hypothetical protein